MKNKNIYIVGVVVALVFGTGGFYVGRITSGKAGVGFNNVQFSRMGGGAGLRNGTRPAGTAAVSGQIISKGSNTLTLSLQNGGSRVVVYGTSTPVRITSAGNPSDVEVGKQVSVIGTANPDGSVTADSIQIR